MTTLGSHATRSIHVRHQPEALGEAQPLPPPGHKQPLVCRRPLACLFPLFFFFFALSLFDARCLLVTLRVRVAVSLFDACCLPVAPCLAFASSLFDALFEALFEAGWSVVGRGLDVVGLLDRRVAEIR